MAVPIEGVVSSYRFFEAYTDYTVIPKCASVHCNDGDISTGDAAGAHSSAHLFLHQLYFGPNILYHRPMFQRANLPISDAFHGSVLLYCVHDNK